MSLATEDILFDSRTSDPSVLVDGMIWYRSDLKQYRLRKNGITVSLTESSSIASSQGNFIQTILTVPTLTANVNNWNPSGFTDKTDLIRVNINANQRQITGIVAPSLGVNRVLGINNLNTASLDLRFAHNSSNSMPANRFLIRDNNSKSIKPNETAWFWYDHIVNRWKPFNRVG